MISFSILKSLRKPPSTKDFGLKFYSLSCSLGRLQLGVDNIHLDVRISPQIYSVLRKTAFLLTVKNSGTENFFKEYKKESLEIEKESLRRLCNDILLDGINKARILREIQIDYLVQIALVKLFLEETACQYKNLIAQMEPLVRMHQLSTKHDQNEVFLIKEKLSEIKRHAHQITRFVGKELIEILTDVNTRKLRDLRETHFPPQDILPHFYLANPMLHTTNPNDDLFLIEEYVLMGQRAEEPDNYKNVKAILYDLLSHIDVTVDGLPNNHSSAEQNRPGHPDLFAGKNTDRFDAILMDPDNMDRLLDYLETEEQYRKAQKAQEAEPTLEKLRKRIEIQKRLLNIFYRKFKRTGAIRKIVAAFEMKPIYEKYCPPMAPRQIREFLINFWTRVSFRAQQKRFTSLYGYEFTLDPLVQIVKQIHRCSIKAQKRYLIMFLKQFAKYHRDLFNLHLLKDAMESIHLATDEKIISLSRENHSLYEFLLPDEKSKEEKPIANHVIIKADIRGSIVINNSMRKMGLNPASYFSLNFFDPISSVLPDYGASKVFIEGDAIILAIFEKEDKEHINYPVARACGLAVRILQIVKSYNEKNQENNLPPLELGIGICYTQGAPSFLFDGSSKIMISQAINQADRMSSCDKMLRKIFKSQNDIFNLFVFENESEEVVDPLVDDFTYRYNVNGIELNEEGFHKLAEEINLQTFVYPSENDESVKLYTGKVPLLNGQYQRIAIREAPLHRVNPYALDVMGKISKKYYEVCTHPDIYKLIEKY